MARQTSTESTARLFHRYVWLVDTIYRVGRITVEELNERWVKNGMSEGENTPCVPFTLPQRY